MRPLLFYDKQPVANFAQLVSRFGSGALASPFRSTVPLLAMIKDGWDDLVTLLGIPAAESPAVHVEYTVPPQGATGNPSCTDAMVLTASAAIAVEAKWMEPRYATLGVRLRQRVSELTRRYPQRAADHLISQRSLMRAWLTMAAGTTGVVPPLERAEGVVYQMLHRVASARSQGRPCRVVYLHFHAFDGHSGISGDVYRKDLRHFYEVLGAPRDLALLYAEVPLTLTAAFREISSLTKGKQALTQKYVQRYWPRLCLPSAPRKLILSRPPNDQSECICAG